jgi:uncharacterized phiE125 gp8 family phage protein
MQIVRDVTTVVAPSATIVTLQAAKDYLRVDYNEDDTLITNLIETARIRLEQYAGIAMSARTLKVVAYVDEFIELPYAPINTISLVEYWDGEAWVSMSVGDYNVLGDTFKKVYMTSPIMSEFRFTYTCGYTTTPESLKTALLKMVGDLYEYRESSVESSKPSANLTTAYELMKPYKRVSIFL